MASAVMQISSKSVAHSSADFGTKNALARIVRRRWPANTVCMVMAEWALTEGEAKGVVYAQASQRTLDKIKKHPRGGWKLCLEIDALVIGADLHDFLGAEKERLAHESAVQAEQASRMDALGRDLAAVASGLFRRPGLAGGEPTRARPELASEHRAFGPRRPPGADL